MEKIVDIKGFFNRKDAHVQCDYLLDQIIKENNGFIFSWQPQAKIGKVLAKFYLLKSI